MGLIFIDLLSYTRGFPGCASGKEPTCLCRKHKRRRFDPRVKKIPWRRARPPTPVFLPGESHGQRSLVGYSPQSHKESDKRLKRPSTHFPYTNDLASSSQWFEKTDFVILTLQTRRLRLWQVRTLSKGHSLLRGEAETQTGEQATEPHVWLTWWAWLPLQASGSGNVGLWPTHERSKPKTYPLIPGIQKTELSLIPFTPGHYRDLQPENVSTLFFKLFI